MTEKCNKAIEETKTDIASTKGLINSGILVLEELGPVVKSMEEAT
jgi:hypothetical protein